MTSSSIEQQCINAIRILSADAIEKAKSGHPGLPMGAAPMGYVLWHKILKHDPADPDWLNRDRFVLSAGHGSMLLYSLLHLTGYARPTIEDIKAFRQWGSITPGHPENTTTPGVEVTTGPLGQGLANAVGMAAAESHLAARFNRPGFPIIDHYTYCLVGDGCLMEGISYEAASLAGHWGLGKLIVLYDDNQISIDGATDLTFTEDITGRFEAMHWQVLEVPEGDTDIAGIEASLEAAKQDTERPTLIRVRTTIGYGCDAKSGSADSHGAPLGTEELQAARSNLDWPHEPFRIPQEVYDHMAASGRRGRDLHREWDAMMERYKEAHPDLYAAFTQQASDRFPDGWEDVLPRDFDPDAKVATRVYSGACLNALATKFKGLFGGSADLSPSNVTLIKDSGDFQKGAYHNQNVRFGVREHAMGAICNGIALHRTGMIPYCASFLAFADYMRNAIRMSALSGAGVIYIFTHDSVAVGEDGPTHQPVEHVAALRIIPNLNVIRPADGRETTGAYLVAVASRNRPTALILTRQAVPMVEGTNPDAVAKGAYVVRDADRLDIVLLASGSELHLCMEAADALAQRGIGARVVSIPSHNLFDAQDAAYRASVLPPDVPRLAVEAGSHFGWSHLLAPNGDMLSIDEFGHSAPGAECMRQAGFTCDNVVARAVALLQRTTS